MNANLEPIEESDLELEKKFKGTGKERPLDKDAGDLKKLDVSPEVKKEVASEVGSAEKDNAYGKILSQVKQPTKQAGSDNEIQADAEMTSKKTDAESQVQHLTDLALNKGVVHAVKVARHLEDNYTLDMFHDKLLADEFHKVLLEKGLI